MLRWAARCAAHSGSSSWHGRGLHAERLDQRAAPPRPARPPRSRRSARARSPARPPSRRRATAAPASCARARSRRARAARGRRSCRSPSTCARGRGCSRTATSTIIPSVPNEPREELGEVIAGDVLDDLAAGVRDRTVRQRDGHAEDEVARRAVAMAQRARVGGRQRRRRPSPRRRRRAAGRARASARRAASVSSSSRSDTPGCSTAVRSPSLCSTIASSAPESTCRPQSAPGVPPGLRAGAADPDRDAVVRAGAQQARRVGGRRGRLAADRVGVRCHRGRLRSAPRRRRARADGGGRGRAPRRTAAASA